MANQARRKPAFTAPRRIRMRKKGAREEFEMGIAFTTFVLCLIVAAVALPLLWYLGKWIARQAPAGSRR